MATDCANCYELHEGGVGCSLLGVLSEPSLRHRGTRGKQSHEDRKGSLQTNWSIMRLDARHSLPGVLSEPSLRHRGTRGKQSHEDRKGSLQTNWSIMRLDAR